MGAKQLNWEMSVKSENTHRIAQTKWQIHSEQEVNPLRPQKVEISGSLGNRYLPTAISDKNMDEGKKNAQEDIGDVEPGDGSQRILQSQNLNDEKIQKTAEFKTQLEHDATQIYLGFFSHRNFVALVRGAVR